MHCGFMDSRLRRFPPDRASAVSYGQTVGNATRCPPLAHRSAAAHKLHSAQSNRYKIRESQNQIPGTGLSLFLPGDCPNDRDHRIPDLSHPHCRMHTTRSSFRRKPESRFPEHKQDPGLRRDDGVFTMYAYGAPICEHKP